MKITGIVVASLIAIGAIAGPAVAKDWTTVRIATEGAFPPWNETTNDGKLAGYEIDLAHDLCARMKVKCTIVAQNWDGTIPGLLAGKYDAIMSGMSDTPKREKVIAFSRSYGSTGQTFAVRKDSSLAKLPMTGDLISLTGEPAKAQKAIDALRTAFKGKVIGVQASSIAMAFVKKNFGDVATIREYKSTQDNDLDLMNGRVDVEMASPAYLMTAAKQPGNGDMAVVGPRLQGGVLGKGSAVGLRKDNTGLKEMFNKAISSAIADGTTKRLSEKWFGFDVTVY